VTIGTVAMAKMTAMLALVSRRKRAISAVMRPAVMAKHVPFRKRDDRAILPRNLFSDSEKNPLNFIDFGGVRRCGAPVQGEDRGCGTRAL